MLKHYLHLLLPLVAAVYPQEGWCQFTDATNGSLAGTGTSFGVAWGDYDQDGDLDLVIAKGSESSKLLRNDGGETFANIALAGGGSGGDFAAGFVDYDNDGDLDIHFMNGNWASRLLRNDHGSFNSVNAGDVTGTGRAQSAAWADYDRDGDLDLFVTHWLESSKLYRNEGNGTLHDVTPTILSSAQNSTGVAWGDYDNDRDPDLYVGSRASGKLYRNDSGTFVDVTTFTLGKVGVTGVAWGDYDNDGDLDLYLARDLNSSRLLRNDSTPSLVDFTDMFIVAVREPGYGQGCAWLDYDNDGDLDIFLAKAGLDNAQGDGNRLFRNDGGDSFANVSTGPILAVANSRGVTVGDYDENGHIDVCVANWGGGNQLLKNVQNGGNWIRVRLMGVESNTNGIGARVRVVTGATHQLREISAGSAIYSQEPPEALIGIGDLITTIDSLQVYWPSGIVTDTTAVAVGQTIVMRETPDQTGVEDGEIPPVARLLAAFPNPFRVGTTISYDLLEASPVRLLVLDPGGRLLRVLESENRQEPGRHVLRWDGRTDSGHRVPPGVYFYSLTTEDFRRSRPVVLVR